MRRRLTTAALGPTSRTRLAMFRPPKPHSRIPLVQTALALCWDPWYRMNHVLEKLCKTKDLQSSWPLSLQYCCSFRTSRRHRPSDVLEALQMSSRKHGASLIQEKVSSTNLTLTMSVSHSTTLKGDAPAPHHIPDPRDATKPTSFARALRSAAADDGTEKRKQEYLGLPFQLSVYTAQDCVSRGVPYLRHS